MLEVADTGVGIADGDQQHLFQRFFRSARTQATPGIGLGLSIVKAIVEAHGGRVTLTSAVARGRRSASRSRSCRPLPPTRTPARRYRDGGG